MIGIQSGEVEGMVGAHKTLSQEVGKLLWKPAHVYRNIIIN